MSDEQSRSGSRWEPALDEGQPLEPIDPQAGAFEVAESPTTVTQVAGPAPRPRRGRRLLGAAVLGAVLVLGGGAGGYALGHATTAVPMQGGSGPGGFRGHGGDGGPGLGGPGAAGPGAGTSGTGTST